MNIMETKIPKTKNEAFAQLDSMLSDKEKSRMSSSIIRDI